MILKPRSAVLLILLASVLSLAGCTTVFNLDKVPDSELVSIDMDWSINIVKIDGTDYYYNSMSAPYVLKIPAGEHTIELYYHDANSYQVGTTEVKVSLSVGKRYSIYPKINGGRVSFVFEEKAP